MTSSTPPELPPNDSRVLQRLQDFGGAALVSELIGIFFRHVPVRLGHARQALRKGDRDGVALATHSIKSSAAQLGAFRLHQIAETIENGSPTAPAATIESQLDMLGVELDAAFQWLADHRRTLIPSGAT